MWICYNTVDYLFCHFNIVFLIFDFFIATVKNATVN
jgi:hypothetical protein